MDDNETPYSGNRSLYPCSRPFIPCIGCCIWIVCIWFIWVQNWSPFFPLRSDSTPVLVSERPDIVSLHDKLPGIRGVLPPRTYYVLKVKHEYLRQHLTTFIIFRKSWQGASIPWSTAIQELNLPKFHFSQHQSQWGYTSSLTRGFAHFAVVVGRCLSVR